MLIRNTSLQVDTSHGLHTKGQNLTPTTPTTKPLASPLGDESVRGYATDERPKYSGAKQMVAVIDHLEQALIPCCMVGEPALIYYGAKRVMFDWIICLPNELLDKAILIFDQQPKDYESFRTSAVKDFTSLNHLYPRYKLVGYAVFFVLAPSQAYHIPVQTNSIEYDRWIHIPYPTLSIYVQSLLDTWHMTDLEDLIDGMNLSIGWGEENLDLEGQVDQEWACWRETKLAGRTLQPEEMPTWSRSRREIWHDVASVQAKKKRQGWKVKPDQLTRFWRSGQGDPRERAKDYS